MTLDSLEFEFSNTKQSIKLGRSFSISLLEEEDLKRLEEGNERTEKTFYLHATVNGRQYSAKGLFQWVDPKVNLTRPSKLAPITTSTKTGASKQSKMTGIDCFDMPQVAGSIPYLGATAALNIRIYPSQGSVAGTTVNAAGCTVGSSPELNQILVIADGFDPNGDRTQESILEDFGEAIALFVQSGFDVVAIDYDDGRDYIQRNGLAVRELLVNILPDWKSSGADDRVVLVAGSMGTQTSRYAMRTSELANEDHDVALWLAIDGPFRGANIPISIQAFVEFFRFSPSVQQALDGLNSPAASQQLLLNRYFDPSQPASSLMASNRWYLPRSEFFSYYNEVNALGLPQNTRSVGIASGSGTRRGQGPGQWDFISQKEFLSVNYERFFSTIIVRTKARSDHLGEAFYGRYKVPSWVCSWPINGSDFCANMTVRLNLNYPRKLDLAPGGYRTSGADIAELWNSSPDSRGHMSSPFGDHNFISSSSALNIPTSNAFYEPDVDPGALLTSRFDRIWYETCNAQHVERTPGMWSVIQNELVAFLTNTTPTTTQPSLVQDCDQPVSTYELSGALTIEGGDAVFRLTPSPGELFSYTAQGHVVYDLYGETATSDDVYLGGWYANISPGQNMVLLPVPTYDDSIPEETETFRMQVRPGTGSDGIVIKYGRDTATGTILDNDQPGGGLGITYWIDSVSDASEGGHVEVVVKRSASPTYEIVRVHAVGGTATPGFDSDTSGVDYITYGPVTDGVGVNSSLITAGQDTVVIRIPTVVDGISEGSESIEIQLHGTSSSDQGLSTILTDVHTAYIND